MNTPPPTGSDKTKKDLEALVAKLEQARYQFEQYFLGLERLAPLNLRREVDTLIRQLSTTQIKNTALKFRYDQQVARYNSLSQYWNRILRQIEDGTYERDLFKLKVHEQERQEQTAAGDKGAPPPVHLDDKLAALPKDGFTAVVRQYLAAKQKAGENVAQADPAKVREMLKKQAEKLSQQFQCKAVQFKVVVEGGKVVLKATPKK